MSVALAMAASAAYGLASFALGAVLYYRLGQRAVAKAIAFERALAFRAAQNVAKIHAEVVNAHSVVSAKLASVKAEIEKVEAEAKAEEQAVVARLKKLL